MDKLTRQYLWTYEATGIKSRNRNSKTHTLGDGTTEKELMIRSGYSSRIFEMSNVPIPDPVPPPSECVS